MTNHIAWKNVGGTNHIIWVSGSPNHISWGCPPATPCGFCNTGTTPRQMQVVLGGFLIAGGCDALNGTYILNQDIVSPSYCTYIYNFSPDVLGYHVLSLNSFAVDVQIQLIPASSGPELQWDLTGLSNPHSCAFSGTSFPLTAGSITAPCYNPALTATVTAIP